MPLKGSTHRLIRWSQHFQCWFREEIPMQIKNQEYWAYDQEAVAMIRFIEDPEYAAKRLTDEAF